jgi:hypothetical protein
MPGTASHGERSPYYGFPNCPRASATSFAAAVLKLTHQPTRSTTLHCTALIIWIKLGRSSDIESGENTASNRTSIVARGSLPSKGSITTAYLQSCCLAMDVVSLFVSRSLPGNGSICHNMNSKGVFLRVPWQFPRRVYCLDDFNTKKFKRFLAVHSLLYQIRKQSLPLQRT